jgi:hypothetical protein
MLDHQPRARPELRKYTPKLCTKEAGSYTYVRAREVPVLTHVRPPAWSVHRALEIYSKVLSTIEAGIPTYVRAQEVQKNLQSSFESSNFAIDLSISVEFIAVAVAI